MSKKVSATGAPIIFLGTGEHFDEFSSFEAQSFVSKLLGMGDIKGLVSTLQDAMPDEKDQEKMVERLSQGQFSLRDLYEQLRQMMKMGRSVFSKSQSQETEYFYTTRSAHCTGQLQV